MNQRASHTEAALGKVAEQMIGQCYSRNSNDIDSFTQCVTEVNSKLDGLQKNVGYWSMFGSIKLSECLAAGRSTSECSNQMGTVFDKIDEEVRKLY